MKYFHFCIAFSSCAGAVEMYRVNFLVQTYANCRNSARRRLISNLALFHVGTLTSLLTETGRRTKLRTYWLSTYSTYLFIFYVCFRFGHFNIWRQHLKISFQHSLRKQSSVLSGLLITQHLFFSQSFLEDLLSCVPGP